MWSSPKSLLLGAMVLSAGLIGSAVETPRPPNLNKSTRPAEASIPFARILNIIVDDQEPFNKVTSQQVTVKRAQYDPTALAILVPGEKDMDLYAQDEITTGPGVIVTIVFLPDPNLSEKAPQNYGEVIVNESSNVRIANPERSKIRVYWGRILTSARGVFNSIIGSGNAQAKSTEFEIRVNREGKGDLLTLEGLVAFTKADLEEPPANDPATAAYWSNWENFRLVKDQVSDTRRVVNLVNKCQQTRHFKIVAPLNLPWITLDPKPAIARIGFEQNEMNISVEPGEKLRVPVVVTFQSTGIAPESHVGELLISCIDCTPDCLLSDILPVRVTILPADNVPVSEEMELKFDKAGPLASPMPASSERLREASELFFKTFDITRLRKTSYLSPPGGIPAFKSTQERDAVFKEANLDAVLKTDPKEKAEAYEKLGDVFRSVGEYERANHAYLKVEAYNPERNKSREFAIKRIDALRGIETLSIFETPILKIATEVDMRSGAEDDRLFTLGHIVLGTAELTRAQRQFSQGNLAGVLKPLVNARRYFEHVLSNRKSFLKPLSKQERAVFWLNFGMVHQTLGTYWLNENKLDEAKQSYLEAVEAFKKAKRADSDNPFVYSNLSFAFSGLGNVERHSTKSDPKKIEKNYQRAERLLKEISRKNPTLLEAEVARVFIDASRGEKAKPLKIVPFTIADVARPVVAPNVKGMLREVAAEILAREILLPDFQEEPTTERTSRQCVFNDPNRVYKNQPVHLKVTNCID